MPPDAEKVAVSGTCAPRSRRRSPFLGREGRALGEHRRLRDSRGSRAEKPLVLRTRPGPSKPARPAPLRQRDAAQPAPARLARRAVRGEPRFQRRRTDATSRTVHHAPVAHVEPHVSVVPAAGAVRAPAHGHDHAHQQLAGVRPRAESLVQLARVERVGVVSALSRHCAALRFA